MDLAHGLEDQKAWSSFHIESLQMRKSRLKKIALSVLKWFSFEQMRTGCDIFNSILMCSLILIFYFTIFHFTKPQNISEVIPTFPYWKPFGLLISDSFL